MNAPAAPSAMLAEMRACAFRLGVAFGREAEAAEAVDQKLRWFELFERCFFSVRVATALELRLRREPAAAREPASDRQDLSERADPPEREDLGERSERLRVDYDRDRETERASFPVLLTTLQRVAADAAALPGPPPAALPALRDLLSHVTATAAPAAPPRGPTLRTRLTGSVTGAVLTRPPLQQRPAGAGLPVVRPATGPPPR